MDVVKISLEALLQRATNPQNQNIDTAAVEAFCALMNKEKDGSIIGIKLLASRIHSQQEQEVLQTLHILDLSMQKCGSAFQSEVGKFRFLNEMIKLVSPKYLGAHTPLSVKQKVLQLMYLWTLDYPKETKIKEAYDMLKKQGVIKEVPLSVSAENYSVPERKSINLFQDDEKSKLLKKLLQSKNPEDLQAANRLIKSMVKEDEKKAELKSKRFSELESIQNNVRLLNEMLESYKPGISSQDELDLIKELHESCERLRPNIVKLASDTQQSTELDAILHTNDELGQVFDKFSLIIVQGKRLPKSETSQSSLLDLIENSNSNVELLQNANVKSNMDVLCDIFSTPNVTKLESEDSILQPTTVNKVSDLNGDIMNNKLKALEDLDALSEKLLQQNLQSASRVGSQFKKIPDKVPMNLLTKSSDAVIMDDLEKDSTIDAFNFDLMSLETRPSGDKQMELDLSGDDILVDITEEQHVIEKEVTVEKMEKSELKLSDLYVDLQSIKPSNVTPVTALENKNGISVTFHFAKDKPHEDVSVVVVTLVSKNELPLKNILFRAIVPKVCKLKLQTPSGTELPPYNPFLPPAAVTQIMLIANPDNVDVSLTFIVSYNIEDETMTEMGEINSLPAIPYL